MAGYVRQDISNEIDTGQVIQAPPLDSEFDALVAAFSAASGHRHNGASGEGAPITVVGPAQNIGISTNSITPSADNTVDLGSSGFEFKDIWIDGTANIDMLVADAGTVGGATIATATSTQTFTNKTIDLTNNTLIATSAQMAAAVTDETGTGALVFADSPVLTGTPTAPTAAASTNTTQLATTAHVFAERANTATLTNKTIDLTNNTLTATSAQLRAALTDETGTGVNVFSDSPAFTGTPTAPTAAAATNTTQLATTAHVFAERTNAATLTNKTFTSPTINGGTITGITDITVADGGTGASTAAGARTNLGIVPGTDVQAFDATLTSIAALGTVADRMLYTTGVDTWAETVSTSFGRSLMDDANAAAAQTTLGLGTMATQGSGAVTITGGSITGITALTVADGGTGSSTAAGARTNLGLVIGTDVQAFGTGLNSWGAVTRAAGFDTFTATPSSANLRALLTDEVGTGAAYFVGGALGTPASVDLTNATNLTTAGIAPATLVVLSETIAANNNDTTIPTSAAVLAANITLGTAVVASSQTSMDWNTIPSWAKRVVVMGTSVSTNGTSSPVVRLGNGSIVSTGYTGNAAAFGPSFASVASATTSGFGILPSAAVLASNSVTFVMTIQKQTGNTWVASCTATDPANPLGVVATGWITLGGTLDRVRLTTSGGTDTFDAGTVNVTWE